jgi:hypothetical protein
MAVELSMKDLAASAHAAYGLIQGDARALPLGSGTVACVLCNMMLYVVRTDLDQIFHEVYRVSSDQGLLFLTVPIRQLDYVLVLSRNLRKLGASGWRRRYVARANDRFQYYNVFDKKGWREKLEETHLAVEQVVSYLTPRQAFWHYVPTAQLFRVCGLLKLLRVGWVKQKVTYVEALIFQLVCANPTLGRRFTKAIRRPVPSS